MKPTHPPFSTHSNLLISKSTSSTTTTTTMIRSIAMFRSSTSTNTTATTKVLCRKHPKHRQSPGVCSLCLSEKLARVSTSGCDKAKARVYYYCSSSSASSSDDDDDEEINDDYYDQNGEYDEDDESSCGSSPESPVRGSHRRIVSDVDRRLNRFDKSSRSMAVANKYNRGGVLRSSNKEKKRGLATNNIIGFWSKLVGNKRSLQHVDHSAMIYRSQPLVSGRSMAVY